tara:strand:- start:1978 stop:3459 length:1482 start_codon:yes stop_codon:yes gene_type:complete
MKKRASQKSAATSKKQAPPKKQAAKKQTAKKQGAKKKSPKKKAVKKKSTPRKATVKQSPPKAAAVKKLVKQPPEDQGGADQHALSGKSTVFASSKTNEWQPFPLLRIIEDQEIRQEMAARKVELDAQYERAEVAYDLLSKEIELQKLRRENKDEKSQGEQRKNYGDVTGIAICFRTKYRQVVSPLQYVLDVNVSRKKDEGQLKASNFDPLPPAINGTPIKVREGSFQFAASSDVGRLAAGDGPAHPVAKDSPILGGQPIADKNHERNFGTLGIVFEMGGKNFGLSNRHVTKSKTVRIISSDFKSQDLGPVEEKVSDHTSNGRYVDASYFSLKLLEAQGVLSIPYQIKDLNDGNAPLDVVFATEEVQNSDRYFPIYKYGAKTGALLNGKITAIKTQVNIGGPKKGVIRVESNTTRFLEGGDSGSVLLIKATVGSKLSWVVIGIVFGQLMDKVGDNFVPNDHVAFGCHISHVLKMLGILDALPAEKLTATWTPVN